MNLQVCASCFFSKNLKWPEDTGEFNYGQDKRSSITFTGKEDQYLSLSFTLITVPFKLCLSVQAGRLPW